MKKSELQEQLKNMILTIDVAECNIDVVAANFVELCRPSQKRRAKRASGNGTVRMLSGKRTKPWLALAPAITDEDGNITRTNLGTYETKSDAEKALAQYAVAPVSSKSNMTLKDVYEDYVSTAEHTKLTQATKWSYSAAFQHMAAYHKKKFADLRKAHFQDMIDNAHPIPRSKNPEIIAKYKDKKLGHSALHDIKVLQGILCKYAFDNDIVHKKYYENVYVGGKKEDKKKPTFSETEIQTLFKHDSLPYVDTILIFIYTGMRITELLRLTKFDIDIDNWLITGGVKTEAGEDRVIPIHTKIRKCVKRLYDSCENHLVEYDREIGNKKHGNKRVVRVRMSEDHYRKYIYYPALEKLGIRRLTPHKARHTFFTLMSEKCTDRKAIAMIGGHSDPNFTEKTYVQPDIERLRKAMECI